jgi:phage regulator Rha-like protein
MSESIVPIINQKGELLVDSRVIAERLDIDHESFMRNIKKYERLIESRFGILRFCIGEIIGRGQPEKFVMLNENQATVLMTLSRNSESVVHCKFDLVDAFSQAKKLLAQPVSASVVVEKLPSRVLALETAKSVVGIKDLLADTDPRLCQMLVDVSINDAMATIKAIAPASETKWMGAVEIAESLNLPVTIKNRTTLGKFVKATCEDLGKQEDRICNGRVIPIWCYPMPNSEVEAAVRKFFD